VGAGLIRRDATQRFARRSQEWSARGRQQDTSYACRALTGHALENCVVLAIDRNQSRTTLSHSVHEQRAGHYKRFLVGQQNALAGAGCGQARSQSGCTDNGRHDDIDLLMSRYIA
jgi:hypothetical protein